MKRYLGIIAMAASLGAAPAAAQTIAVGTTGIGANIVITTAIAQALSTHTDLNVITQQYGGEAQILPVVNAGRLEIGVSNAMELISGYEGTGTFEGQPQGNLRMIASLMPITVGVTVWAESDMYDIGDLKGRTLASGFNAQPLARMLHEGYLANAGLTYDDVEQVLASTIADHWDFFAEGRVDAVSMAYGSAKARELEASVGELRYLNFDPSPEAQERLAAKIPGAYVVHFEADPNIPGLDEPTYLASYDYTIWTNEDLDDEIVYKILETVYDYADELSESGPQWRGFDPKAMSKDVGVPFHPAALRFFEDRGIGTESE
jgi:uncharacterized protein